MLKETCLKSAETETNISLFQKMVKNMVATNDVRDFVAKQSNMRRLDKKLDMKLIKISMKRKLTGAYSYLNRLEQKKKIETISD